MYLSNCIPDLHKISFSPNNSYFDLTIHLGNKKSRCEKKRVIIMHKSHKKLKKRAKKTTQRWLLATNVEFNIHDEKVSANKIN